MTIDLFSLAAQARWRAGSHQLNFGQDARSKGGVMMRRLTMENGQTRNVLWTHPEWVARGNIKGWLPWMRLPANATMFEATVGFAQGATASDGVTFMVYAHYYEGGREVWTRVASLQKPYNKRLATLRADLSHLAGKDVSIELRVDTGPSSAQDWACWTSARLNANVRNAVLPVNIKLEQFICHNAQEDALFSNGDEPYLWVVYFTADGKSINLAHLGDARAATFSPRGSHNNLGRKGVKKGDSFPIPAKLGHWRTLMRPVQGLPLAIGQALAQGGFAIIALEEDSSPASAAEAGRRELVRSLQTELDQAIGNAPATPDIEGMSSRIQTKVTKAVKQEHLSSLWGILGAIDPDDYVGSGFQMHSYREIQQAGARGRSFALHFRNTGVHYEVRGKVYVH